MKNNKWEFNGYIAIYKPDHKRAIKSGGSVGYVYEHHIIAELMLGRELREDEIVHHFNFNPLDNRIQNLMVMPQSQHMKLHRLLDYFKMEDLIKEHATEGHHVYQCNNCFKYLLKDKDFCGRDCKADYKINNKKDKPSKAELKNMVENMQLVEIANQYNVQRKNVKQWMDEYRIS
ncbi:HNH endonuclease [Peribacillus sp. NPDC097198]|uniref:HNH endonuclease n=1 Tax=Peribacillus sp. NPDC097198 TaxID=3364397 RepID=UPI00381EEE9C